MMATSLRIGVQSGIALTAGRKRNNLYDIVIIGGGHNGLTCAAYLAAAGLKVLVLERRSIVGGAAVTEEFHPGFRNSIASYTVSLLNPKVIRDLNLHEHGLRIVERKLANFLPLDDHRYFKVGGGRTQQELSKFSVPDSERLEAYNTRLEQVADVLRKLVLQTPPNRVQAHPLEAIRQLIRAGLTARQIAKLGLVSERDLLALFTSSAGQYLESWFESDPIKAVLGFDGIVGNYASPFSPGTAYVLLHHCFGEINGKKGVWGHAIGGMGAITQAMARACIQRGVEIRTDVTVTEVVITRGRVSGIVTDDGTKIAANAVVANVNPKLLYEKMIDPLVLPADFRARMAQYRCGSATFRMNVALSELPSFLCLPGTELDEHHTAGIIMAPSLRYMEDAYFDARRLGWARKPIVEMVISSTLDDTLAPKGCHVASLFCQHMAPELPDGTSWDERREEVADLIIDTVTGFAPNFKASVLARQIMSPVDLERTFGLIAGDIFHGALDLGQLYSARPVLGHANYRGPIPGLYMCGSGTHPGGGVTGVPGHNAAREIIRDFRRRSF